MARSPEQIKKAKEAKAKKAEAAAAKKATEKAEAEAKAQAEKEAAAAAGNSDAETKDPKTTEEKEDKTPANSPKKGKKATYILLAGRHIDESGKKYVKDDEVSSTVDLEKVFKNKFRKK